MEASPTVRLTQFSHGAGCGCKIAPGILEQILHSNRAFPGENRLLVGNSGRDDAAVYDLENGTALISTTDFFMPIVDDPVTFGRIAAANAISDVYAMGGTPILAISILGWPVDQLPAGIAAAVLSGGRQACEEAGIVLAGGHSIDSPEPIFGLAVNGLVDVAHLKRNDTAQPGDWLFLTKPLGVGILATAEKKGLLSERDAGLAVAEMVKLNRVGAAFGALPGVHAMTDVTGFGLLGHLTEMCEGSQVTAEVYADRIPLVTDLAPYLLQQAVPGGTHRNWQSYGHRIGPLTGDQRLILSDPQTSGGLLAAVAPDAVDAFTSILDEAGLAAFGTPIGRILPARHEPVLITITGARN